MSHSFKYRSLLAAAAFALPVFSAGSAVATTGYFSHGYGAASKGMAGTGTAMALDTQSAMRNPASMFDVGDRLDLDLSFFAPDRSTTGVTGGAIPSLSESDKGLFFIPGFGVNKKVRDNLTIGLTVSGNGGMNTHYPNAVFSNFGAGSAPTGVDLSQLFVGATVAGEVADGHSLGITPTFAYQRFEAYGLEAFAGFSASPGNVTNRGYDNSWGGGVRVGYRGRLSDGLYVGASYQTKMYMTKFDKYKGLFAEQGGVDIPAAVQLGVAYDVTPAVTISADWERIMYGDVKSIANTGSQAFGTTLLGDDNGPGFGWRDVDVFRIGGQWKASDKLTLRAGASINDQPFASNEVLFNTLAPGVVTKHLSVGLSYDFGPNHGISASYTRAFSDSVTGTHINLSGQILKVEMDQHDFVVGYTYRW